MKTTLISFYSDIDDTKYYSKHAKRLRANCKELGISYDIRKKKSLGDYQLNCLSKPQFILDTLNKIEEPIVWMDIDTIIHKSLDIFDTLSEFDVVVSSSNKQVSGAKASPIYFNNTPGAKQFLIQWKTNTELVISNKDALFDHEVLFPLLGAFSTKESPIKIGYLPVEYCVWPGESNEDSILTMGLADNEDKKDALRKMGMNEDHIEWQATGNKFLDNEGKVKI